MFARRRATVRKRSQPFATVRHLSQPFATVRNRSQPFVRARSLWPCLYGKFCNGGRFWIFKRRVASFRLAGVALRDIQTCFVTCRKSFCVAGNTFNFASFSKDGFQFSWRAQHFGRVHLHFAWQPQHFRRVLRRDFCESHCQGCVKW